MSARRTSIGNDVGVPTYWVIDAEAREVEVWTPEATFPSVESERLTWHPAGAGAKFELELAELLKPI